MGEGDLQSRIPHRPGSARDNVGAGVQGGVVHCSEQSAGLDGVAVVEGDAGDCIGDFFGGDGGGGGGDAFEEGEEGGVVFVRGWRRHVAFFFRTV